MSGRGRLYGSSIQKQNKVDRVRLGKRGISYSRRDHNVDVCFVSVDLLCVNVNNKSPGVLHLDLGLPQGDPSSQSVERLQGA